MIVIRTKEHTVTSTLTGGGIFVDGMFVGNAILHLLAGALTNDHNIRHVVATLSEVAPLENRLAAANIT